MASTSSRFAPRTQTARMLHCLAIVTICQRILHILDPSGACSRGFQAYTSGEAPTFFLCPLPRTSLATYASLRSLTTLPHTLQTDKAFATLAGKSSHQAHKSFPYPPPSRKEIAGRDESGHLAGLGLAKDACQQNEAARYPQMIGGHFVVMCR